MPSPPLARVFHRSTLKKVGSTISCGAAGWREKFGVLTASDLFHKVPRSSFGFNVKLTKVFPDDPECKKLYTPKERHR